MLIHQNDYLGFAIIYIGKKGMITRSRNTMVTTVKSKKNEYSSVTNNPAKQKRVLNAAHGIHIIVYNFVTIQVPSQSI